jgi:hypothetical protein
MPEIVISDASESAHQEESSFSTDPQPESVVLDPDPVPVATVGPEEQQLSAASSLLVPPETADQSAEVTSSSSSSIDGDASGGGESGPVVSSEPDNNSKYSPAPGSCGGEDPVLGPLVAAVAMTSSCRRFEKRKRDQREDSLDSTHTVSSHQSSLRSSSGGGGLYNNQSDTGSVQSHRFSTISISSNVSSDVSFGNASAVSGSSCYLASMSSADFDDRPALASSFSLSEAEENEYLSSQYGGGGEDGGGVGEEGGGQQREEEQPLLPDNVVDSMESSEARKSGKTAAVSTTNAVKKDQLSPPRPDGKLPALPSADRHKLRSLFRRSNDGNGGGSTGRSKNSSYESRKSFQMSADSRSREGGGGSEEAGSNGGGSHAGSSSTASNRSSAVMSAPRSRIGTGSSLTPATSLEQTTSATTCVEQQHRCSSSSFEDEMRRSLNREDDEEGGNAVVSATDSEDSAEAGGSLTHHRYYHVFREGEIDHMIEKYVENLHIIRSYYDHANWCVVAEKVNVWTI